MTRNEAFIDWLVHLKPRAHTNLRRSLRYPVGEHIQAMVLVEPFVSEKDSSWQRQVLYIVGGSYALHRLHGEVEMNFAFSLAQAATSNEKLAPYTERWFTRLLNTTESDLVRSRLTRLLLPLKDIPIDWTRLTNDLMYWQHSDAKVQRRWTRSFYRKKGDRNE